MQAAHVQGCAGATLDELVGAGVLPQPSHIKIDVDGFEHKVVAGAARALRDAKLRSMIVEINRNLPTHRALVEDIGALGFRWDESQVVAAERRSGPFQGLAEYIFVR